uniref:Rho-GAP domain-containing protein n=1 Tax=Hucho hucho TaxID=62062 RepID=A0A4W5RB56_9TELE
MGQYDTQALSEALMGFLQDLPSPVIPKSVYPSLKTTLQEEEEMSVGETGRCLLKALEPPAVPLPSLFTLHYLLRHLDRVSQSSAHNDLDPHTLAFLFSPLLLTAGSVSHLNKYCTYVGLKTFRQNICFYLNSNLDES